MYAMALRTGRTAKSTVYAHLCSPRMDELFHPKVFIQVDWLMLLITMNFLLRWVPDV